MASVVLSQLCDEVFTLARNVSAAAVLQQRRFIPVFNCPFALQTLGDDITVKMYSPSWPNFDYTLVVIFVIAVFTVALGGYWSGLIEL